MAVSNTADLFSQLFNTFTTLAILVGVVVFALMTYLILRFRAKPSEADPEDAPRLGMIPDSRGHVKTAIISVALSSIIVGVLIFGTLSVNSQINTIPSVCTPRPGQCLYIEVTGYRFAWNFTYPNGVSHRDNLTIPAGRIIVLEISSKDVFHSFGIDDFRTKRDAIPGLTNKIWFIANDPGGVHMARCFELCGSAHAFMTATVSTVSSNLCSSSGC
jgi:cytochrome c oxidase subunit 2